jgi:hypothetical protein
MTLDRRRFFQLSALGIVAVVAESACAAPSDRPAAFDRPQLLEMLGPERVRQIGAHYRSSMPSESRADTLRAALSGGHRSLRIPFIKSGSLDDQIRDDFADGRTVVVDGWVLSVTEARQAALFSLTPE